MTKNFCFRILTHDGWYQWCSSVVELSKIMRCVVSYKHIFNVHLFEFRVIHAVSYALRSHDVSDDLKLLLGCPIVWVIIFIHLVLILAVV